MKRSFCLLFSVVLILLLALSAYAEEGFFLDTALKDDGTVEVEVSYYGDKKPIVAQFTVDFDENQLDCVEAFSGNALKGVTAPTINVTDGKIYFVWDSLKASSEGTFLKMTFKGKNEKVSNAEIGFDTEDNFIFADENYSPLCQADKIPQAVKVNLGVQDESGAPSEKEPEVEPVEKPKEKPEEQEETGYNQGFAMEENKSEMALGERKVLNITDGVRKEEKLVWSSSNEKVATVNENGEIVAVAPGKAIITVTSEDGTKESTCVITVTEGSIHAEKPNKGSPSSEKKSGYLLPVILGGAVIAVAGLIFYRKKSKSVDTI